MIFTPSFRSMLNMFGLAWVLGLASAVAAESTLRTPAPSAAEKLGAAPQAAVPALPFLAIFGDDPPLDSAEAERLRKLVDAFVTRLHGPRRLGAWDMVFEKQAFRVTPRQAWLRSRATQPEVWLALGAALPEGSRRLHGSMLRLFVLGFDAQGRLETRSRSPWMEEGFYGMPPFMLDPLRVGPDRWAFVSITPQVQGGSRLSTYKLRAPKGPGFQRLGDFWHQSSDGTFELWTERLELLARPSDEVATCWPLVAVRTRFAGRSLPEEGRQLWQRERHIPCNSFGTYGTLGIN